MELAERRPIDDWDVTRLVVEVGPLPAGLKPKEGTPDPAALAAFLAEKPAAVAFFGDLARVAVQRIADRVGGAGSITAAAVVERAAGIRRALAGDAPNAVELLLAERAALCWAVVHQYELAYFGRLGERLSHADHRFFEGRIDAAHRRLLSSLRTLATVRRLKLPDLLAVVSVAVPRPVDARE